MSINYICRHCLASMGTIPNDVVNEYQLGFHFLTVEERNDIISYSPNGDITVKVICDYCKQAIETHPELSLLTNPLQ